MDERNVVELSLRLPAGELGRLAQLMEQVRGLLSMEGGGAAGPAPEGSGGNAVEAEVNTAFDAARFQQLDEARSAAVERRNGSEAGPEKAEASAEKGELHAPGSSAEVENDSDKAVSAESDVESAPDAASVEAEVSAELEIPAVDAQLSAGPEVPVGSVEAMEKAELQTPSAALAEDRAEVSVPSSAVSEVQRGPEPAERAGLPVETTPAEARGGTFAAVEELVSAGPAPLTAESVALAFQRDDRRYDNGFPLY